MVPKIWSKPPWEGVWNNLDPWDSVRLRTASTHWNVPGKLRATRRALFLPHKEGAGGGIK